MLFGVIFVFDETYDKTKSAWTKKNRGVDFVEARIVWNDPEAIEGPADLKDGEERWLKVGRVEDSIWTVGFAYRNNKIRIFMVRPARKDERKVLWPNKVLWSCGCSIVKFKNPSGLSNIISCKNKSDTARSIWVKYQNGVNFVWKIVFK